MKDETSKIAILGTGRSGTKFFSAVLKELGKEVLHEDMGADGIASWCLVADVEHAIYGPGRAALDSSFALGHQVRDPLKTIGSLTTFNRSSWKFIAENSPPLPGKIMYRAMTHWLDWNQKAADLSSFSWTLESLESSQPEILNALGWEVPEEEWKSAQVRAKHGANTGSSRSQNSLFNPKVGPITQLRRFRHENRKSPVNWAELSKIDTALTQEIQDFAHALGCKIESDEGKYI